MIVKCKYCHTILYNPIGNKYRCWKCHTWLIKDEIIIVNPQPAQKGNIEQIQFPAHP